MGRKDVLSVIEAAYNVEASEQDWLQRLVGAARHDLDKGFGVCAYVYDARRLPLRIERMHAVGNLKLEEATRSAVEMSSVNEDYVDATWRSRSFATVSETVDMQKIEAARGFVERGMNDILVVNAYDLSEIGVWLGAPLEKARAPSLAERRVWNRVATHLAAAFRLRRSMSGSELEASAVLSPSGKLEDANGAAAERSARTSLRDAVTRMERARGPLRRRDSEAAVSQWTPLVHGRWSLLDQFERNGKRYIVAVENEPQPTLKALLAPRELQVLAAIASGRSNKIAAYELGLSDSTVRVLLMRAARKLDVRTRAELVAVYGAHARASRLLVE